MAQFVCMQCSRTFDAKRKYAPYCSQKCYHDSRKGIPLAITPEGLKRLRLSKMGDKNPAKRPEVGQKISDALRGNPRLAGPAHPNFKGGWKGHSKKSKKEYFKVWVSHEERPLHPTVSSRGYILRSHYVWNKEHPDDLVQKGEVVHHLDGDTLNDSPKNLQKMAHQRDHASEHFRRPRKPLSEEHKRDISNTKRHSKPSPS